MKSRTGGDRTRVEMIARANEWRRQVVGSFVSGEGSVEDVQIEAVRPQSLGFSARDLVHWVGVLERRRDGALRKFRAINSRIAQGRGNPERLKAERAGLQDLSRSLNEALKVFQAEQFRRETTKAASPAPKPVKTVKTETVLEPSPVRDGRTKKVLSKRRRKALKKSHDARTKVRLRGFEELAEYEINNNHAAKIAA